MKARMSRELFYSENPEFDNLLKRMGKIFDAKNKDYSNGNLYKNFFESERIKISPSKGVILRMLDKVSRICNLINKERFEVKDESIEDTLLDLANYSLIAILVLRKERESINNKRLRRVKTLFDKLLFLIKKCRRWFYVTARENE